jgi:anti-sigma regulatory factor (Ser/Thr protein kinase)
MSAAEVNATSPVTVQFGCRYPASAEHFPRARGEIRAALAAYGLSADGAYYATVMFNELFTNAVIHHQARRGELVHVGIYRSEDAHGLWFGIAVTDAGCGAVRSVKEAAVRRPDNAHGLGVIRGLGGRLTDVRVPGGYTVVAWFPASDQLRAQVCPCDCLSWHGARPSVCAWVAEGREACVTSAAEDKLLDRLCAACLRQVEEIGASTDIDRFRALAMAGGSS